MGWVDFLLAVGAAIVAILGVLGLRLAFTFDWNKYHETRQRERKARLRMLCTHTRLIDGHMEGRFISPPRRFDWLCDRCGFAVGHKETALEIVQAWANDPAGWSKREQKFEKHVRKFYRL